MRHRFREFSFLKIYLCIYFGERESMRVHAPLRGGAKGERISSIHPAEQGAQCGA